MGMMGFETIHGHRRPIRILQGTIRKKRVPAALLFSGDSGIGKRSTALIYIQALNCLALTDGDACGTCVSCQKIRSGNHPDLLVIEPEGNDIKIETIRAVEGFLSMKPFEGRTKAVLIDNADAMNINASNAFLKTLEEPPADSVIILISASPDSLSDTIRSRCFQVRFSPLPAAECTAVLDAADKEGLNAIQRMLAMGRPGLALAGTHGADAQRCADIYAAMARGETKDAWADREDMEQWLSLVPLVFRDLAVARIGAGETLLLRDVQKPAPLEAIIAAYRAVQQVQARAAFNLNKGITWQYVSEIVRGHKSESRTQYSEGKSRQ